MPRLPTNDLSVGAKQGETSVKSWKVGNPKQSMLKTCVVFRLRLALNLQRKLMQVDECSLTSVFYGVVVIKAARKC